MERSEKKQRSREWREKNRSRTIAELPFSLSILDEMIESVEALMSDPGCDNTLCLTECWLKKNGYTIPTVVEWLNSLGGFCDCEVVANVGDHIAEIRSWVEL